LLPVVFVSEKSCEAERSVLIINQKSLHGYASSVIMKLRSAKMLHKSNMRVSDMLLIVNNLYEMLQYSNINYRKVT
jgi:hypothetical protein